MEYGGESCSAGEIAYAKRVLSKLAALREGPLMARPKPREYIVHELMATSNMFFVMASSKAEALEKVQSADITEIESYEGDVMPTGKWWVEPRRMRNDG